MTQVTALERAVIRNIAVAGQEAQVRAIAEGPEAVKANQVGAVLLNLKRKGVVVMPTIQTAVLTSAGLEVLEREWPSVDRLDALRKASNEELNRVRPKSVEELRVTNALIELRRDALRLLSSLS